MQSFAYVCFPHDLTSVMDRMELSPCPVPGGIPSGASNGSMEKAKQRRTKDDKQCAVCGDKALGYNFDAVSCESCKAFFRRNAPKGLVSIWLNQNNC